MPPTPGRDALTHEFKGVKWGEVCGDGSDEDCSIPAKDVTYDILLIVSFVPGLKVDAILLLRTIKSRLVIYFVLTADIHVHQFFKTSNFKTGFHPLPGAQETIHKLNLEKSCLINSSWILRITQPLKIAAQSKENVTPSGSKLANLNNEPGISTLGDMDSMFHQDHFFVLILTFG
ncbi:hypothetical protein TB1_036262 [Malus domestica]